MDETVEHGGGRMSPRDRGLHQVCATNVCIVVEFFFADFEIYTA